MNLTERIIDFWVHTWLGIPRAVTGPLALPVQPVKPPKPAQNNGIKFTERGIPYREITPDDGADRAWQILGQPEQRSTVDATQEQIKSAIKKGFAVDTVLKIYRLWKEGRSQPEIAKMAGVSLPTVKGITPHFKKQV